MLLMVVAVAAICLVTGPSIALRGTALFRELTLGNREHFRSCTDLPAAEEVERTLANHQEMVDRIHQVNPGRIVVYADGSRCPGKADIVILFATVEDSRAIRRIIKGDAFFGMPYRMYNT